MEYGATHESRCSTGSTSYADSLQNGHIENRALLAPAVQFHHEDLPGVSEVGEKNEEESAMKIYPWMKRMHSAQCE